MVGEAPERGVNFSRRNVSQRFKVDVISVDVLAESGCHNLLVSSPNTFSVDYIFFGRLKLSFQQPT